MSKEKCGNCFHWLKAASVTIGQPAQGLCRERSPQLVYFFSPPDQRGQSNVTLQAAFPPIAAEGYCGRHKPLPPKLGS